MNENKQNTVCRTIQVLECLFENDFKGKSETEISKQTDIPLTSVFRILKTLKALDWVDDYPVNGTKAKIWKVNGTLLIGIANKYDEATLNKVHELETEYLETTGKALKR